MRPANSAAVRATTNACFASEVEWKVNREGTIIAVNLTVPTAYKILITTFIVCAGIMRARREQDGPDRGIARQHHAADRLRNVR
jgi:hypothetical protein